MLPFKFLQTHVGLLNCLLLQQPKQSETNNLIILHSRVMLILEIKNTIACELRLIGPQYFPSISHNNRLQKSNLCWRSVASKLEHALSGRNTFHSESPVSIATCCKVYRGALLHSTKKDLLHSNFLTSCPLSYNTQNESVSARFLGILVIKHRHWKPDVLHNLVYTLPLHGYTSVYIICYQGLGKINIWTQYCVYISVLCLLSHHSVTISLTW